MRNETATLTEHETKEFYSDRADKALQSCLGEGYVSAFMPEFLDERIKAGKEIHKIQPEIIRKNYTTMSIRAKGKTRQGNQVEVYAHAPTYFSILQNITNAIEEGLVDGAGVFPRKEFLKLLDSEDKKNIFVINKSAHSEIIELCRALQKPHLVAFFGGKERAEKYLEVHEKIYGKFCYTDKIKSTFKEFPKGADRPLARFLYIGGFIYDGLGGWVGDNDLCNKFETNHPFIEDRLGTGTRFLGFKKADKSFNQSL